MSSITAHCLVKNEENFVGYAIRSVLDYVEKVLIFDTGSEDKTVEIIKDLQKQYPEKIIFEEKGECNKVRHTQLRQEMIERTKTEWFMILDGDEVWTKRSMDEALEIMQTSSETECIMAPFYLCVGDVLHCSHKGKFEILGVRDHVTARFFKIVRGIHWVGEYGKDTLFDNSEKVFFTKKNTVFLKNRFWHLTHLKRSSYDAYSSGGMRISKERLSYFLMGHKIKEKIPEVFDYEFLKNNLISFSKSFSNFVLLLISKVFLYSKKHKKELTRYIIIGITGTILDLGTLFVFKTYLGMSAVFSVVVNQLLVLQYIFFMNKFWSFGSRGQTSAQMVRFYMLYGVNYIIAVVWMWVFHDLFGAQYLLVRLVNIGASTLWNFSLYKYWVFVYS